MKILAIETSCDETAVALLETKGVTKRQDVRVLGNALLSQTATHEHMGGVVPMLAKREHNKNLVPLLESALRQAKVHTKSTTKKLTKIDEKKLRKILEREPELLELFLASVPFLKVPPINAIAVTQGPGLEPALWVGINFAKALSYLWKKPIIPVNHMEGHIVSSLLIEGVKDHFAYELPKFPLLALLISGGHTELVLTKKIGNYKIVGQTRDDAVGEAFDKVARMLGLSYPGGPQISKLAEQARNKKTTPKIKLPRPMIKSGDNDFSFAGLKTAVLYALKQIPKITESIKEEISLEFENAATEVLVAKTKKVLTDTGSKTLIIGGGVSANKHIRQSFKDMISKDLPSVTLLIPEAGLTTDNAIMIGLAGSLKKGKTKSGASLKAEGNLRLS